MSAILVASDGVTDPRFRLWSEDANRRYEMARLQYREAHPHVTSEEIVRLETHLEVVKERWLEKLQGMRD